MLPKQHPRKHAGECGTAEKQKSAQEQCYRALLLGLWWSNTEYIHEGVDEEFQQRHRTPRLPQNAPLTGRLCPFAQKTQFERRASFACATAKPVHVYPKTPGDPLGSPLHCVAAHST